MMLADCLCKATYPIDLFKMTRKNKEQVVARNLRYLAGNQLVSS
jgi:hypothetical protein